MLFFTQVCVHTASHIWACAHLVFLFVCLSTRVSKETLRCSLCMINKAVCEVLVVVNKGANIETALGELGYIL